MLTLEEIYIRTILDALSYAPPKRVLVEVYEEVQCFDEDGRLAWNIKYSPQTLTHNEVPVMRPRYGETKS